MNSIDKFSSLLFEEAKRFLETANASSDQVSQTAFCHAAMLLAFSSLEAHMNAVSDELALRKDLDVLTKSILLERDYRLEKGLFKLSSSTLKMYRLEDRLDFLFTNFSISQSGANKKWWGDLKNGLKLRNRLVHPKEAFPLTIQDTEKCLLAIIECLNSLYLAIFKKPHPSFNRKLDSNLNF